MWLLPNGTGGAQPVAGTALGDMAWNMWQSRIGEICGDIGIELTSM
jgi:hypothetical protein